MQDSLALAVLNVFVDMERTDNSVEFEQKFSRFCNENFLHDVDNLSSRRYCKRFDR